MLFTFHRVTFDFRILFEIVPNGLGGALRGHVSIDNLKMRNCFADSPRKDSCSLLQIKCNQSKIPVCIENARICDLVQDCDDLEDENLNCGKLLLYTLFIQQVKSSKYVNVFVWGDQF